MLHLGIPKVKNKIVSIAHYLKEEEEFIFANKSV